MKALRYVVAKADTQSMSVSFSLPSGYKAYESGLVL